MDSPFKLLVYVIIATLLLFVFFTYLVPYFFPQEEAFTFIESNLSRAEFNYGKVVTTERFVFPAETVFKAELFDSKTRSSAFECNSIEICCDKGIECPKPIYWDDRIVKFKKKRGVDTSFRCNYEHHLFVCRVYFGKKPAQVEIVELNVPQKIDLSEGNTVRVRLKIKNSGEFPIVFGKIELRPYFTFVENDLEQKEFLGLTEHDFGEILPEEEIEEEVSFKVDKIGKHYLEVKVSGENAGFEEKKEYFEVEETANLKCRATEKENDIFWDSEADKCKEKYNCENCTYGFECEEAWEKKVPGTDFISADPFHAILFVNETSCIGDPENATAGMDLTGWDFTVDPTMPSTITKIGLDWSVPIAIENMPLRNGLPKWDPFNHPNDTLNYNAGLYPHRFKSIHRGMDIYAKSNGVPVMAIADGVVFKVSSYGLYILHTGTGGEQYTSIYGHVRGDKSLVGKEVKRGQVIGTVNYSPPHVHLEIYSKKVNAGAPSSILTKCNKRSDNGGCKILSNDPYLINPVYLIGTYGK